MGYKRSISVIILDDHGRVVLSGDETEDYINASYIDVITRLFLFMTKKKKRKRNKPPLCHDLYVRTG